MAHALRIQFPGAIYHAMARGNARQTIFRDERDDGWLLEGVEATVDKFCSEIFSFVCMPNHSHLFFPTPEPNLSLGMQYLLSGYANWFTTGSTGQVFPLSTVSGRAAMWQRGWPVE